MENEDLGTVARFDELLMQSIVKSKDQEVSVKKATAIPATWRYDTTVPSLGVWKWKDKT
jgi:hypothetical protein